MTYIVEFNSYRINKLFTSSTFEGYSYTNDRSRYLIYTSMSKLYHKTTPELIQEEDHRWGIFNTIFFGECVVVEEDVVKEKRVKVGPRLR